MTDKSHTYTPLASVKNGTKVDVYGVVKFVKPPFKTRGPDYCITFSIMDSSYDQPDQKLKCNLFAREESKLPMVKVGEIIRFHRLNITKYQGEPQASSCPGMSWLIFSGRREVTLEPRESSSLNYTLTDTDKKTVKKLQDWIAGQEQFRENFTKFEDISGGCYFDTVCQVVCRAVLEPDVCMLLRVWDGTLCLNETRKADQNTLLEKEESKSLLKQSGDFLHDIFVFDDHLKTAKNVSPGDFVKFYNLHCVEWTSSDKAINHRPSIPPVELVLHRGNSYGRSLRVVPPDCPDIKSFIRRLQKVSTFEDDEDDIVEIEIFSDENYNESDSYEKYLSANENVKKKAKCDETAVKGKPVSSDNIHNSQEPSTSGIQSTVSKRHPGENIQSTDTITDRVSQNVVNKKQAIDPNSQNPDSFRDQGAQSNHTKFIFKEPLLSGSKKSQLVEKTNINSLKFVIKPSSVQKVVNKNQDKDIHDPKEQSSSRTLRKRKSANMLGPDDKVESVNQAQMETNFVGSTEMSGSNSNENQSSGIPRCMMETAAITLNHPLIKPTNIKDVLDHKTPYKFRIRAKIMDYYPKPTDVETFLQLYCPYCHFLSPLPGKDCNENDSGASQLQIGSTFKDVVHYNCPQCYANKDSLEGLDSPPHLQFIYMMRFLLKDDTGMLMSNVWRSEAEVFFQNIEPEKLLKDPSYLSQVKDMLNLICPEGDTMETKPWIECCVKSYSVAEGTGYQIFDTTIA